MFLAKITNGTKPIVTEVADEELVATADGRFVRRPRQGKAWKIVGGAAAVSQTPSGAIASAKGVLEREMLKQRGDGRPCRPKYQRAHIA